MNAGEGDAGVDYSLLAKRQHSSVGDLGTWDVFISAYNSSARVNSVFDAVSATEKHWLVHDEYDYSPEEYPLGGRVFVPAGERESDLWLKYFDWAPDVLPGSSVCIDITGMMRPALMLAVKMFAVRGFEKVSFIYTDPVRYAKGVKTLFAQGAVSEIRQVEGFEGDHSAQAGESDILILGSGYDHRLIQQVAEAKRAARKIQMFGLPSLQHHMYQEGRFRAHGAAESVAPVADDGVVFAPAHDPFETAQVLSETVRKARRTGDESVYLSPLATKAQALGFALYYLVEADGVSPTSMLFPFAPRYSRETSEGISRVSVFDVELDWCLCSEGGVI